MIRVTCDQTGEDLTGKRHLSITRQSLRIQEGGGAWKSASPITERGGVLYFKNWDALAEWGKEHEKMVEQDEWNETPSRDFRVAY